VLGIPSFLLFTTVGLTATMAETVTIPPSTASRGAQMKLDIASKDPNEPIDLHIPDNYVSHTLKTVKPLPPITLQNLHKNINYLSLTILTVTPLLAIIGLFTTTLQVKTFWFSVFYYYFTGLGALPQLTNGETFLRSAYRYHGWISSFMGSPIL
jgi:hypothetical protein